MEAAAKKKVKENPKKEMANLPGQQPHLAQPNYGNIAQNLRGLADEAVLFPNIPLIDQGQQIIVLLNQTQQDVNQIRQDFNQIRQDFNQMIQGQNQIRQEINRMIQGQNQIQHDILRKNNFSRLCNSSITRSDSLMEPLVDVNGHLTHGFPRNRANIRRLQGDDIDRLLRELGLHIDPAEAVHTRKEHFLRFIGMVSSGL
ncbi:hypothetical protein L211DRAFT_404450 [Terfezia boudieri ATCC MYA-4762]|uniref:DUF1773 domain-containing protein n=1 Tax=Terfezia boudieri ATCC MYA-4762 TaxID=1051890 RepID=A0A3N4M0K9_9PEZI|nr:hypothetical protein L211DRAFT_404450 [Terfezia boudieri ATCC MYA-4762]